MNPLPNVFIFCHSCKILLQNTEILQNEINKLQRKLAFAYSFAQCPSYWNEFLFYPYFSYPQTSGKLRNIMLIPIANVTLRRAVYVTCINAILLTVFRVLVDN